jgi:hypothetical protein
MDGPQAWWLGWELIISPRIRSPTLPSIAENLGLALTLRHDLRNGQEHMRYWGTECNQLALDKSSVELLRTC